jgi:hypothetical protein
MGLFRKKSIMAMVCIFHALCPLDLFCYSHIPVIYTAAVLEKSYEMRKKEYLHALEVLEKFGVAPYILESCQAGSFFDETTAAVFYTKTNNYSLRNKGVNEAKALLCGLPQLGLDPDQIVVKITGRYFFTEPTLFDLIDQYPEIDAFVKRPLNSLSTFTGCFALRSRLLHQFLLGLDFQKMEKEMINIEDELTRFLERNPNIRVLNIDTLDVTANIFGEGKCSLTHW